MVEAPPASRRVGVDARRPPPTSLYPGSRQITRQGSGESHHPHALLLPLFVGARVPAPLLLADHPTPWGPCPEAAGNGGAGSGIAAPGGEKACDKGWECSGSRFCCGVTVSDYFQAPHFEKLFPRRNATLAHASGFWSYRAFIDAAALFEPRGFGTAGGKETGIREVAAFLAHVGAMTSCGIIATNDSLSWGLCYNRELSPS